MIAHNYIDATGAPDDSPGYTLTTTDSGIVTISAESWANMAKWPAEWTIDLSHMTRWQRFVALVRLIWNGKADIEL
jgi:hypothetical protein